MPQPGSSDIDYPQGYFRAMLQFMATCNDQTICKHISNVGRNPTYISPRIQNDLLDAKGASLEKSILSTRTYNNMVKMSKHIHHAYYY